MRYYLREKDPVSGKIYRENKVRRDMEDVLRTMKFGSITVDGVASVGMGAYRKFREDFGALQEDDILLIHLPMFTNLIILRRLFRSLSRRGIRVYFIVHDINDFLEESTSLCRYCEGLIVNNEKTALELIKRKIDVSKILSLDLLDYLIPDSISGSCGDFGLNKPVVVAGTLSREEAGFVYRLPDNCRFNLYGDGYEGNTGDHVFFGGNYLPDEIPYMIEGSFGLVWDGPSPQTCLGVAGKTMKVVNPYQLSLYLSSGMPVIVWSESAAADLVIQKGCGFTVTSLAEIGYRIKDMSEKTYKKMKTSAEDIGIPMRDGCYLRRTIMKLGGEPKGEWE